MSADNWAICPRCVYRKDRKDREARRLHDEATAAYGTVPIAEWKRLEALAVEACAPITERTFREDYEIGGAEDGEVTVSYQGGCSVCKLSLSFQHDAPVLGIEDPA